MTKTIVVIGATGKQGGSVVESFLHVPGWKVRGVTRNPTSPAAKALTEKGVEVIQGNLDDPSSLPAAFEGANAIYAVTDFWTPIFDGSSEGKVKPGQGILEWAYELEVQRGKNIADAAAPIIGKPLEKFIWSALSDVNERSNGKWTSALHFDGKAAVTKYIYEAQPKLAKIMSMIQIGMYARTALDFPPFQPAKKLDGTYEFSLPMRGGAPFPYMIVEKDTGEFVKALIELPPGQKILGYSAMMSWDEFAEIFSETNGVKAKVVQNTVEDIEKVYGPVGRAAGDSFLYVAELGFDGADPTATHPQDIKVKVQVSDVKQWIREQDWSKVL